MRRSIISAGVALAFLTGMLGIGAAQASTFVPATIVWHHLGYETDTTYIDNCDGTTGSVRVGMEWQYSTGYANTYLQVNFSPSGHGSGITITNNSKLSLHFHGGTSQIQGGISEIYINPDTGVGGTITTYKTSPIIAPGKTYQVNTDAVSAWVRMDGSSSGSSPSRLLAFATYDPGFEFAAFGYDSHGNLCAGGGGTQQAFFTEIANTYA